MKDLVENNTENIDVNFVRNFGNNAYGNNFNSSYARHAYVSNKYTSGNNISNDLETMIRSFISTQKELNKKIIAKFEKYDALNDKVDRLTKEIVYFKNMMHAQKSHEETVKYVQDIIDRSWETLNRMDELEKESVMVVEEKKVEEVKMLSDTISDPLLDLDKCSLNELITILQKFSNDPSFNAHQSGFGSFIANHVIKEKIQRYNNDVMIPPKLGDAWIPKIQITIGKETYHAILDLGSSVCVLSKDLYDLLDIGKK